MSGEKKQDNAPTQEQQQQVFLIGENLLQGIANYLANQRYAEVAGLIEGLKQVQPVNVQPAEEEKKGASKKKA